MANSPQNTTRLSLGPVLCSLLAAPMAACLTGCAGLGGYSNESLYPQDVRNVCVEMFDNRSFRRDVEYTLSDALVKRVVTETPYEIVSDTNRADSVLSGQLILVDESILTLERETGRPLETEVVLRAVVSWKNLQTGRLMINNETVAATASYSPFQGQDFTYASALAANKLARKIVELMEDKW